MSEMIRSFFSEKSVGFYLCGFILFYGGFGEFNGYRDINSAAPVSYSGKIKFFSVGKGRAIGMIDPDGRRLISCHSFQCGYANYDADLGKDAVFVAKDNLVVEISVEGVKKLTEEMASGRNDAKRFAGVLWSIYGLACIFLGILCRSSKGP